MISSLDPLALVGATLLGLFAALSWMTRRVHGGKSGRFGGRERVVLTDQHTVQVIEIGGVRLLVGTGPSGAPRVLAELGEVEDAVELEAPARFGMRPWAALFGRLGAEGGR